MIVSLNGLGTEKKGPDRPRPTLPALELPDIDDREIEEAAARVAEKRIIRLGRDAWESVSKAESFENWKLIGHALQIGRGVAVRATGVTTGKHYAKSFYDWADRYGFAGMNKEARWAAVDLAENEKAITIWRDSLPERQRKKLIHPLSVTRRWRRATGQTKSKCADDLQRAAAVAWRRFVSCVEALPPEQATPLWEAMCAQAAVFLNKTTRRI